MNRALLNDACDKLVSVLPEGGFGLSVFDATGEIAHEERNWTPETLIPVWSTTKGPAVATIHWLLEKHGLNLHSSVSDIWPEFRNKATMGELLSHQAGLAAMEENLSVYDHAAVAKALAIQPSNWIPGTAHGYHPRTFGYLLDEISLRLTGERLGVIWQREIAGPLELDFYMGLPESEFSRVAKVSSGRASPRPEEKEFVRAFMDAGSLTRRAFDGLKGLNATFEFNYKEAWQMASPAFGGVASARGVAKFYAVLANGGSGIFSPFSLLDMQGELAGGMDVILKMPVTFTAGFQKDPLGTDGRKLRQHYGPSLKAFGHPGAGGSLGFADPEIGWGIGLVLNVLSPGVFPRQEILDVIAALYS